MTLTALPNSVGEFFGLTFPGYVDTRVLAASVAEVIPVPPGARFVLFSSTADFFAKANAAAAIPAADVTDGSASELNPTIRRVEGVTTIGIISPAGGTVSLSFYS